MDPTELDALLRERWGVADAVVESVDGGMNSAVWRVAVDGRTAYLKSVPEADADALAAGADVAGALARSGFRAGAPLLDRSGEAVVMAAGRAWALLEEVVGVPLTASSVSELHDWGAALGRAHRLAPAAPESTGDADPLDWVPIELDPTTGPDWLRSGTVRARKEVAALGALTRVRLHTDPEPGAFLRDDSGDIGIIDWTGSRPGPALYDLASAVMYAGGQRNAAPLIASYLEHGPLPGREVADHLATFSRFRGVVQGLYFVSRLARNDLTGIADEGGNRKGLDDAERMLEELGRDGSR